jgi:hypothetical protein
MADVFWSACFLATKGSDYLSSAPHFFSTTRIVGRVSKGVPGDYAVAVGDDDSACLSEAPIRVLLPGLTRNFVEIIGPNLDVIDFGFHDTT